MSVEATKRDIINLGSVISSMLSGVEIVQCSAAIGASLVIRLSAVICHVPQLLDKI